MAAPRTGVAATTVANWEEHIKDTDGGAYTIVAPLSVQGLIVSRLIVSGRGVSETSKPVSQLSDYLGSLSGQDQPQIVQLAWKEASGGVHFSGGNSPAYSLCVSRYTVLNGAGFDSVLSHRTESNCRVVIHEPDLEQDAWLEYYLKRIFCEVYQQILNRFEHLTGRALTESLSRIVALHAARQNLQISVSNGELDDQEIFSSSQSAGQAYRQLLNEIFSQFTTVLGAGLLVTTLREVLGKLPDRDQMIIRSYKLFPEEIIHE